MNISYYNFEAALKPLMCFTVQDVKKHFPDFDRKRLSDWQKKGYVKKLIKENYIFNDLQRDTFFWWYIANSIYKPSYVSLQSALNYYGFIPEAVFQVTNVTTRLTKTIDTNEVRLNYRNIKKSGFFGYTLLEFRNGYYLKIAEPEKAIIDLLHLEPSIQSALEFKAWRFNKQVMLETLDISLLDSYALQMDNKYLNNRLMYFKDWLYA